jgi:ribonuclease D
VLTTPDEVRRAAERLAAGTGPVAVDAERASGYRYGQRAYLVQVRRAGTGTLLVDPAAVPDLAELGAAADGAEWVLHAASQDLACLAEVGLRPPRLFDTELAGRIAGHARVALGPLVEEVLGVRLEKGHSAADWSRRPLPESWLRYAALDVELLVELRDALAAELTAQGRLSWAEQEFAAVLAAPPAPPRIDPWRRTSGLHRVRTRRQLAIVRALWERRDALARDRDIAPGRVLPDTAVVAAALASPPGERELLEVPGFGGRATRRLLPQWWAAVHSALTLPESDLPAKTTGRGDGPPAPSRWAQRDAEAAARWTAVRAVLDGLAEDLGIRVENVLPPEAVRRLAWEPPLDLTGAAVAAALRANGARPWQVDLTASALATALTGAAPAP